MKYFNWQKIYKNAQESRLQISDSVPVQPTTPTAKLSITSLHLQAWSDLSRTCSQPQLEKLSRLAWQYECGKREP